MANDIERYIEYRKEIVQGSDYLELKKKISEGSATEREKDIMCMLNLMLCSMHGSIGAEMHEELMKC